MPRRGQMVKKRTGVKSPLGEPPGQVRPTLIKHLQA